LQRPDLYHQIAMLLEDDDVEVRAEAANALGQAAQGARADSVRQNVYVSDALHILSTRLGRDTHPRVRGVLARSIGRLPYRDSATARVAERRIVASVSSGALSPHATGVAHGLYSLARARRTLGPLGDSAITWLVNVVIASPAADGAIGRRLALLALTANGSARGDVAERAARDPDPQVRRINVAYVGAARVPEARDIVAGALRDDSAMVRLEAVRVWRQLFATSDCAPLVAAFRDPAAHVALAAIDASGGACPDSSAISDELQKIAASRFEFANVRLRTDAAFHAGAHALVALARLTPEVARPLLQGATSAREWQTRMYAARAAAIVRDSVTLVRLASDSDGNVREAAIEGLAATAGHVADRLFTSALESPHYQVVIAAATALRGAPAKDSVVPALIAALERITNERRETSRDPRMAILETLSELGSAHHAARLEALRQDFDTTVATRVAAILSRWTGRTVTASPHPLPIDSTELVRMSGRRELTLRIRMASPEGGRVIEVRLDPGAAPATVGRLVKLARGGYYDGKTFHRVAANFVIQGGSPAANEYVGDGPFMRDELGLASHERGTLGISTRGRDTGDAQLFVNLIDNFRLDHEYTVFGRVVQGMNVVDEVLEGDVIERIEVIERR
jgi:cyclophilin family peptidyl-prolyl cis-trans isomerase/HEAT repeat protein